MPNEDPSVKMFPIKGMKINVSTNHDYSTYVVYKVYIDTYLDRVKKNGVTSDTTDG